MMALRHKNNKLHTDAALLARRSMGDGTPMEFASRQFGG
jgi:hypothetical protein